MSAYSLPVRPLEFFFAQYRRVWRGTAISSVVTPVLFLLAFGFGLGELVDRSTDLPDGITYLEFVAPGLIAATAMQIASFEASWPVLSAIKWSRQYHAMLASPLRVGDVLIGHQAFIAFRMLMTASVYLAVIAAFGAVNSPLGILAIPVAVLVGIAFAAPIAAWAAYTQHEASFVAIFRFLILPMFLFSGTFFPIDQLPEALQYVAYVTPLWHGVDLARQLTLGDVDLPSALGHLAYLLAFIAAGLTAAYYSYRRRPSLASRRAIIPKRALMAELAADTRFGPRTRPRIGGLLIVERNAMVYRRTWMILFSGFFEPLFYLFFFVYPLGDVIGNVAFDQETLEYAAFVAPALLAASAMNGAFYDATNVFWKLRYGKVYDAMLSTPVSPSDVAVGETMWAVVRSMLYSAAFLNIILVLGLVESWWGLLILPACFVIGFGFAGAGIAAVTWMRNWQDFDLIQLVMLPMFLFATTFFPLSVYPQAIEWIVQALPLYQGIELVRSLATGAVGAYQLVNVAYLLTMGAVGMFIASRRIDGLLLK